MHKSRRDSCLRGLTRFRESWGGKFQIPSTLPVQFHTDKNLEDVLASEIARKLHLSLTVLHPTNTGHVSSDIPVDALRDLLQNPPALWSPTKVRLELFRTDASGPETLEKTLKELLHAASEPILQLGLNAINCRVVVGPTCNLSGNMVLAIVRNALGEHQISLQFQRKLPFLHLQISGTRIRGALEIGRFFRNKVPLQAHHTPLSPPAGYALIRLALQNTFPAEITLLDPMCGNGTLLYLCAFESRQRQIPFSGVGLDSDPESISAARENLRVAGDTVTFKVSHVEAFVKDLLARPPNLILTHPPYGFSPPLSQSELERLYDAVFAIFAQFPAATCGLVTPHLDLLTQMIQKYSFQTAILRSFQQKTLPAYLWASKPRTM